MRHNVRIVRTLSDWVALGVDLSKRHVADVETQGTDPRDGKLLGVALAPLSGTFADGSEAAYVVVQEYIYSRSEWVASSVEHRDLHNHTLYDSVAHFLSSTELVGHNYCGDRAWLDSFFKVETVWHADTRLTWHMSSAPAKADGYGLKDAQVRVLGWAARGDEELAEQVRARGGSLSNGDHYLADTEVLGYYSGLDVVSTAQLYAATKPHFDQHAQWELLSDMMRFSALLDLNTRLGVRVDVPKLEKVTADLKEGLEKSREELRSLLSKYVSRLEEEWREDKAAGFSDTPAGRAARDRFLASPDRWTRFNPGSDKQKRELFYGVMGLPIVKLVKPRKDKKTGKRKYSKTPATTQDAVALSIVQSGRKDLLPVLEAYDRAERLETLHNNFASKWLKAVKFSRIHPPFNPCGTVSYRISGYAPYFLNLPFKERELMECFSCDEGFGGVHADFVSVEPTITAHYSQDPGLLKVFRDGLGDVYLDLALSIFPDEAALHAEYDPNVPLDPKVKKKFSALRDVAKVVQLAIPYTGTEYTISMNLRCTLERGAEILERYWQHFSAVARMNERIVRLHDKQGFIRNAIGRVIRMPWTEHKDTPNRMIQSSGHDLLTMWVLSIHRECQARKIDAVPILVDSHDATSWAAPKHQVPALRQVFEDTLREVNERVKLSVPIRAEVKEFYTLAGLKGDE